MKRLNLSMKYRGINIMAISFISLLLIGCNSNSNVKSESVKQEVKMNNVEKVSELKIEYTNGLN